MPRPLRHPSIWLMLLAVTLLTASTALVYVPESQAERVITRSALDAMPVNDKHLAHIRRQLSLPSARQYAKDAIHQAREQAMYGALAQSESDAFDRAKSAILDQDFDQAQQLAKALKKRFESLEDDTIQGSKTAHANLLLARAHFLAKRHTQAIRALNDVPSTTPVEDYRLWMLAQSHEAQGDWARALKYYNRLDALPQSPMFHRARAKSAHMLFENQQWDLAKKSLQQLNALYPDYPRRHLSLLQYAKTLEAIGELQDATDAYHKAWFDFPYKKTAQEAQERLQALVEKGLTPPALSYEDRYSRIRRLRINKHWDIARDMFLQLEKELDWSNEVLAKTRQSEIWMQLALNAYIPKRYEEALFYLEKLKASYESGWRRGIDRYMVYKYLAIMLAKFGHLDRATKELNRAYLSLRDRNLARAEFLASHGRYQKALNILSPITTPTGKRSWSYSWLLYKTGKFKEAKRNFEALAKVSSGKRRAKYLYWAARISERQGKTSQAKREFKAIADEFKTNFYALQSKNRIWDINNPVASPSLIAKQTGRLTQSEQEPLAEGFQTPPERDDQDYWAQALALDRMERRSRLRALKPTQEDRAIEPFLCNPGATNPNDMTTLCALAKQVDGAPIATASHTKALEAPELQTLGSPATTPAIAPKESEAEAIAFLPKNRVKLTSPDNTKYKRPESHTDARIFWTGHNKNTLQEFAKYDAGEPIGPMPDTYEAYGDAKPYKGALRKTIAKWGKLFPELERARWLHEIGMNKEARWAVRDVALEYKELSKLYMPSAKPHQLQRRRMSPLIDNRRVKKSTWGYLENQPRWPISKDPLTKKAQLARQRSIISSRHAMRADLVNSLKEVGDYYMVRKFTLEKGIRGNLERRRQAYPRAFPELVLPHAKKWGVNPYLIWSLMTVESSYNPDSVSVAQALGLLQVIPRTGLKNAGLLGEEDFGHYDLLDEDVAIRHGVFYFGQLVRKFHGQELFAMAGYNGGPHRVAEWIDMRGDMPMDEFIEEIPYDQAREYTKKVSRFLHMYLRIYENVDTLYIGQQIQRTWRPMPNF